LWANGHQVFTPSLTGIGERSHLTSPTVSLSTHISDVVNTILYEDLDDIVLVGFSYGGMVVTGALEHVADRVAQLVYLDAFVPTDGQSALDILGRPAPAAEIEGAWLLPPMPREFEDADEGAWNQVRRSQQPLRTFTEPVRLAKPVDDHAIGLTYIKATGDERAPDGPDAFWDAADRVRDDDRWSYHEVDSNHMIPQNRPAELAAILGSIAQSVT
jgi:pimeloyl-ACP methyl ester carboxylesterase